MFAGFFEVILKRFLQLLVRRCLDEQRQRLRHLLFCIVEVEQLVDKKIAEIFEGFHDVEG